MNNQLTPADKELIRLLMTIALAHSPAATADVTDQIEALARKIGITK